MEKSTDIQNTDIKILPQINPNSMCIWWDKVKDLDIPMPRTSILKIDYDLVLSLFDGDNAFFEKYEAAIFEQAGRFGYPFFLRTDLCSGKHSWKDTCFVDKPSKVIQNTFNLLEDNEIKWLQPTALVFRSYIYLYHNFVAFRGSLPISRERRYFVRDGKVECHHPYWPEAAVSQGNPQWPHWESCLKHLNTETEDEVCTLTKYAETLGSRLEGYWSIDFAMGDSTQDITWYFIDAGTGDDSYHWPDCEFNLERAD